MLLENNTLPIHNYKAKKILCPIGLEYQKIHVCPNDCLLYGDVVYRGLKRKLMEIVVMKTKMVHLLRDVVLAYNTLIQMIVFH